MPSAASSRMTSSTSATSSGSSADGDLVEQQEVGLHRQRADDRRPLLLAAGQPVGEFVALVGQAEARQQLHRPRLGLGLRTASSTLRGASVTLRSTVMCGNRLNAWNTMPMRRRTRLTSTPRPVISSPSIQMRPASIVLEQVDAAQQRRLARPGGADQAHDLVLGDGQVDAAQHLQVVEGLVQALDAQRLRPRPSSARSPASWRRRSRAASQSTKRASGMVSTRNSRPQPGTA